MLAPDDRSVLRELLRPPAGMQLDIAVGTTFTLDLESAVVVPLGFASSELANIADPIAVLESIRSVAQRVSIFAQVGQLRVPGRPSDLMSFLEPMVHEAAAPRSGYLFHPKIWVLKFVQNSDVGIEPAYRLVCGTRNLTGDASWDAVVHLDGVVRQRRPDARNRPLAQLVRRLPRLAVRSLDADRVQAIDVLADDLRSVSWDLPEGASTVDFHALGIGERGASQRMSAATTGDRCLVVSPFLDDDSVRSFRDWTADFHVVSRPEALDRLEPEVLDGVTTWVIDPFAGLSEIGDGGPDDGGSATGDTNDGRTPGLLGGLHAKIYAIEQGRATRLLIGSCNATAAGSGDLNVEFAVEFTGQRKVLGIDRMLDDATEFRSIITRYEPTPTSAVDPVETVGRELERLLRRLAAERFEARVESSDTGWTQRVAGSGHLPALDDTRCTLGLLTIPGIVVDQVGPGIAATFDVVEIADITPFITLAVSRRVGAVDVVRSTVIRVALIGDPPGRLDSVLARQVDSPEKFLRFVMLLLALGDVPTGWDETGRGTDGAWAALAAGRAGLFETLARAVADRPQVIDDIDRLVERLRTTEAGRSVLPEGFEQLWDVVTAAQRLIPAAHSTRSGKP